MPTPKLREFFAKIQGGDEAVLEAMLEETDPFLRRAIRMRLLHRRLRRAVETRGRLDESARLLLDLRAQGLTRQEIAAKVGGRADVLRMRLNRAVSGVLAELGNKE